MCLENDFDFEDPYIIGYQESCEIVEDASRWVGVGTIEAVDIEFIGKFISLNEEILRIWIDDEKKFGEISNQFIIPKPKNIWFIIQVKAVDLLHKNIKLIGLHMTKIGFESL